LFTFVLEFNNLALLVAEKIEAIKNKFGSYDPHYFYVGYSTPDFYNHIDPNHCKQCREIFEYMVKNKEQMKTTKENWEQATANLRNRGVRSTVGESVEAIRVRDYAAHLLKVYVGESLLDVGCGDQFIKKCIDPKVRYIGLDAFPVFSNPALLYETWMGNIEDEKWIEFFDKKIDTICAFAVMDNCLDFDKAIENMKQIAQKNIVFLTGANIEVDRFHTFKLQLSDFDYRFSDWNKTYAEEIIPKVWLLEYTRP